MKQERGCMGALHSIRTGYYSIILVIAEHGAYLRMCTERSCVPECHCPGDPPAQVAYHHVQERGAVAPDRVKMSQPRTDQADLISLRGRVKDPEGESPHHAAVGQAAATTFVDKQCGLVRHGPGLHADQRMLRMSDRTMQDVCLYPVRIVLQGLQGQNPCIWQAIPRQQLPAGCRP